jgi:hypothetical protein
LVHSSKPWPCFKGDPFSSLFFPSFVVYGHVFCHIFDLWQVMFILGFRFISTKLHDSHSHFTKITSFVDHFSPYVTKKMWPSQYQKPKPYHLQLHPYLLASGLPRFEAQKVMSFVFWVQYLCMFFFSQFLLSRLNCFKTMIENDTILLFAITSRNLVIGNYHMQLIFACNTCIVKPYSCIRQVTHDM